MIFIGIDPGKDGAVAWMDGERNRIEIADAPLLPTREYDIFAAYELLKTASCDGVEKVCLVIEDTISVPHTAKGQRFLPASDKWLHFSLGMWQGLAAAFRIPVNVVHPKTWKAAIFAGIANDDAAEEMAVIRRFSGHDITAKLRGRLGGRKPGRVDALAICEYGRSLWKVTGSLAA